MRPRVLIGLGNPLSGDDYVGCYVAERLANDPRVPDDTDIVCGGTDLFRQADQIVGRDQVILVDALLDDSDPGTVSVLEEGNLQVGSPRGHAHHLSVSEAVRLLRAVLPPLATTRFKIVLISIDSARNASALSYHLARRLPQIVDRVLRELCECR